MYLGYRIECGWGGASAAGLPVAPRVGLQDRLGQLGHAHDPRLRARQGLHLDLQLDFTAKRERGVAGDRTAVGLSLQVLLER